VDRQTSKVQECRYKNCGDGEFGAHRLLRPLAHGWLLEIVDTSQICCNRNEEDESSPHSAEFHCGIERQTDTHRARHDRFQRRNVQSDMSLSDSYLFLASIQCSLVCPYFCQNAYQQQCTSGKPRRIQIVSAGLSRADLMSM
jgi:hypothetical protein